MSFLELEYLISPDRLNRLLGFCTYGVVTYQFLQTALFGSHLTNYHPWLSSLFPLTVDDTSRMGLNAFWDWQYRHPFFNNVLLLFLFGAQHSFQSRLWMKSGLRRMLTPWMERLFFVAGTSLAFSLITNFWQPMISPVIWDFRQTSLESGLNGLFYAALAWILVTLAYDAKHDLFGFRKSFGEQVTEPGFLQYIPPVYRANRAPLFTGLVLSYWATPIMTFGHFLFASLMTLYTVSAVQLQERDKLTRYGAQYAEYQRRVPLLIPSLNSLFNSDSTITVASAVQEKFGEKIDKFSSERPPIVSPVDVHRYQHVGKR